MAQFMLSVHTANGNAPQMTEEEQRQGYAKIAGLESRVTDAIGQPIEVRPLAGSRSGGAPI